MSSKEDILAKIRRNTGTRYEKPDLTGLQQHALTYPDKLAQFAEIMKGVGGRTYVMKEGEDINQVIKTLYPEARRIASDLKEVDICGQKEPLTCATFHPDDVQDSKELNGTDLAVIQGRLGVCENGAVWIRQDVEQRAIYFISEALAIILDRKNLVNNMHEAYTRIDTGNYGYGVFISGPSKTADIEQALVMGAHGAHYVTVILV